MCSVCHNPAGMCEHTNMEQSLQVQSQSQSQDDNADSERPALLRMLPEDGTGDGRTPSSRSMSRVSKVLTFESTGLEKLPKSSSFSKLHNNNNNSVQSFSSSSAAATNKRKRGCSPSSSSSSSSSSSAAADTNSSAADGGGGGGKKKKHKSNDSLYSSSSATAAAAVTAILSQGVVPGLFVFCASTCKNIQPARLEVYCAKCSTFEGTGFVPARRPDSWDDVMWDGSLGGFCGTCNSEQSANVLPVCSTCSETAYPLPDVVGQVCAAEDSQSSPKHPQEKKPAAAEAQEKEPLECCACFESTAAHYATFRCAGDAHYLCADCFESYAESKIVERNLVLDQNTLHYSIGCPYKCADTFVDSQMFRLCGQTIFTKYRRYSALLYSEHVGLSWCPSATCKNGNIIVDKNRGKQHCHACGSDYCRRCSAMPCHDESTSCDLTKGQSSDEVASLELIQSICKPCPGCKVIIFKDGGCNHMSCEQCHFQFCWIHLKEWGDACSSDHWYDDATSTTLINLREQIKTSVAAAASKCTLQ
jgi:hypothetical protein